MMAREQESLVYKTNHSLQKCLVQLHIVSYCAFQLLITLRCSEVRKNALVVCVGDLPSSHTDTRRCPINMGKRISRSSDARERFKDYGARSRPINPR
jgi:hypothetical protein